MINRLQVGLCGSALPPAYRATLITEGVTSFSLDLSPSSEIEDPIGQQLDLWIFHASDPSVAQEQQLERWETLAAESQVTLLVITPPSDMNSVGHCEPCLEDDYRLGIYNNLSGDQFMQTLHFAAQHTHLCTATRQLNKSLCAQGKGMEKLVEVGTALTAEKDLDRLLVKILQEGMDPRRLRCSITFFSGKRK